MVSEAGSSSCGPGPAGPRASLRSPPALLRHPSAGTIVTAVAALLPVSPVAASGTSRTGMRESAGGPLLRRTAGQDRPGRIVGDARGLEELDLRVHAVALEDAVEPRP